MEEMPEEKEEEESQQEVKGKYLEISLKFP